MYNKNAVTFGQAIQTSEICTIAGEFSHVIYNIYSYSRWMAEFSIFYKLEDTDEQHCSIRVNNDVVNFSVASKKHFNAFLHRMMDLYPVQFSYDTNEQEYNVNFLED